MKTQDKLPEAGHYGSKRAAFTLAEVLITLGIIGVVAALTIPTLTKEIQKRQWVVGLQKGISVLNEGFKRMEYEGDLADYLSKKCTSDVSCHFRTNDECNAIIQKYFKGTLNSNKCSPTIRKYRYSYSERMETYPNYPANNYTLANGMTVDFNFSNYSSHVATLDVNGINNGPNIMGRDVFAIQFDSINGRILPYGQSKEKFLKWAQDSFNDIPDDIRDLQEEIDAYGDDASSWVAFLTNDMNRLQERYDHGFDSEKEWQDYLDLCVIKERTTDINGNVINVGDGRRYCTLRVMNNNWKMDY